ncbi:MAG: kelch repeat-containing protein [Bacteroidia bacterium]
MKKIYSFTLLLCFIFGISDSNAQTQYAWVQKAKFGGVARHRASGASCGNRGYMGLGHYNSVAPDVLFQDWWEYDPGTDTWTQKANFGGGLRYHCAAFTIGNFIYIGTGRAPNSVLMNDFWKYDVVNNTWSPIANFPGAARRGAVAFAINGFGYVGTGSYYADFYKYDPVANQWTAVAPLPASGRISAVAFMINNKGYVGTGDVGGPSGDLWEYNPTTNSWTAKANLPGLPRMEATGFALNGKGYIGTGDNFSSGTNYQDFWCFDPASNTWLQVADFAGAARRYLCSFTIGNRAYAGTGTSGINYDDFWEYGTISDITELNEQVDINVYPNPATENVTFSFSKQLNNALFFLYDSGGKMLSREQFSGTRFLMNRENLAAGVYFYSITSEEQYVSNGKIVLQ